MRPLEEIKDRIRGCLMAGAAGDALGYTVEFDHRDEILATFGEQGITKFKLDPRGIALISDDTQMTLFTANGELMGLTRGYMRGIGGTPEHYVQYAYEDWYYTQKGKPQEEYYSYTWLYHLPELWSRRAPGVTCLDACRNIINHQEVRNDSKGCGGVMRVAPLALYMAGHNVRKEGIPYSPEELAVAGGVIAECTHKHPLGYLPAAALTNLLYNIVLLPTEQAKHDINRLVWDSTYILDKAYPEEEFREARDEMQRLCDKALKLAHSDLSDAEAILKLGEGWVGEEAWAIAIFCVVRHINSVEDAIITSVNHSGDSDSTGSITGNIMGAIYGYEHIKERDILCPDGHRLEQTLELAEVILAIADDLATGCPIAAYEPIDTPEKIQWYVRYCKMLPEGIGGRRYPEEWY